MTVRTRRWVTSLLAVTALTVTACGGSDGDDEGGKKGSTTTERSGTTEETTTTAPEVADPTDLRWSEIAGGLPGAGNLNGITATPEGGFLVVGVDTDSSRTGLWSSDDGSEWTPVETDEDVFGADEGGADITTDGERYAMVGGSTEGEAVRAWYSDDGETWKEASGLEGVSGFATVVHADDKGFYALIAGDSNTTLMTSSDGAEWSVAGQPIDPAEDDTVINDVVRRDGGFYAVGSTTPTGQRGDAVVYAGNSEGEDWGDVPGIDATNTDGYESISAVVAGGPGYVAVGTQAIGDGAEAGAVWTSEDGQDWTLAEGGAEVFGGGTTSVGLDAVVTDADGNLLATGRSSTDEGATFGVWTSSDGATWERTNVDPALSGGQQIVVTGLALGAEGAVSVVRIKEFDASQGSFETTELRAYRGAAA